MTRRAFITGVVAYGCQRSPLIDRQVPRLPDPPPPPPPPAPEVYVGVIQTGQSLSVGVGGFPVINTATRYGNLKLGWNTVDVPWTRSGALVEAGEPNRKGTTGAYPYNCYEGHNSPLTAIQDQISKCSIDATGVNLKTVGDNAGSDSYNYDLIKQGTANFEGSIVTLQAARTIAQGLGKDYRLGLVVVTHGESDYYEATYDAKLVQLFNDYATRARAITGQTSDPIKIVSQPSAGHPPAGGKSLSTLLILKASKDNADIFLSGPKYQYAYTGDAIHMIASSSQALGVKYGQVYDLISRGTDWKPLQPVSAVRVGTTITLTLDVPVAPVQFDETLDTLHVGAWGNGRGFEVFDNVGPIGIDSVTIASPSTIEIELSSTPGAGCTLAYAMSLPVSGQTRRGQVCDSDPFIGFDDEIVACEVTGGSTTVTPTATLNHGPRDLAVHPSLPLGTIVTAYDGTTAILSQPWGGASGTVPINFRSDQRNYLVQFEMAVA